MRIPFNSLTDRNLIIDPKRVSQSQVMIHTNDRLSRAAHLGALIWAVFGNLN